MAIQKREFYEGAALHRIARAGIGYRLTYEDPFFVLDELLALYIKYSTAVKSPWAFTFWPAEQTLIESESKRRGVVLMLVCASNGIATLTSEEFLAVAPPAEGAVRVACARRYGEFYEVSGPMGRLDRKVSPNRMQRLIPVIAKRRAG